MPSRPIHQVLADRPFVNVSIFTSVREVTQLMQAQHCSAALITEHGVLTGIFTEFAEDAFHPNDRGYEIWADTFWPLVQNRVEESVARIAE